MTSSCVSGRDKAWRGQDCHIHIGAYTFALFSLNAIG